tara:strand:+ start:5 stop:295 length:291 start_codon:yes stop_codon:yes gene_type:complete
MYILDMMIKDPNGRLKRISNFILLLFGVNGVICVLTTILGLLTDKRMLGTLNISYISGLNKFLWNIQFFSFWILALGIVVGAFIGILITLFKSESN